MTSIATPATTTTVHIRPQPAFARVTGPPEVLVKSLRGAELRQSKRNAQQLKDSHDEEEKEIYFEAYTQLEPPPLQRHCILPYLDWIWFAALLVVGITTIGTAGTLTWSDTLGPMLFNGGLTPLILSLWSLFTGAELFRQGNLIKAGLSTILLLSGALAIGWANDGDDDDEEPSSSVVSRMRNSFGTGLFEVGALFFITKLCLLEEDAEMRIQRLEKSLAEAMVSQSFGLASSYFYNFVLPTAKSLRRSDERAAWNSTTAFPTLNPPTLLQGQTPLEMEVTRNEYVPSALKVSQLVILVPRDLTVSHNIKDFLLSGCRAGNWF